MSLISDALRKAHVEAAQQDRRQYRDYMNNAGRASAAHSVSHGSVVLAAVVGGCVTAGAGLLYLTRTVRAPAPSRGVVVVQQASKPAAAAFPAPVVNVSPAEAAPVARQPSPRAPRRAAAPKPALPAATREEPVHAAARLTEAPPAVESTPAAPPRRVSRDNFVEGRTYGSPLQGPLGSELVLTGISSVRGGEPVAIINGGVVRAGAIVGPFAIEAIEATRVRVRYVDVHFWLSY